MLREIVENVVQSQPDMELVSCKSTGDLETAIQRSRAKFVIPGDRASTSGGTPEQLLLRNPELKVVVVKADGRDAKLFELRHHSLVDFSPQSLIDTIPTSLSGDG